MAGELERLLVSIEADTQKMRMAMKEAEAALNGYESKVDKSLAKAESRFKKHGSSLMAEAKQLAAAYLGVTSTLSAISSGADASKLSEQLGIAFDKYQALRSAALAAGVAHDTLDASLKKLSVGFAGVQTQSGELYEFLRTQLPTVYAQMRGQKDLAGAIDVAAEAIRLLSSQHDRALVASKLFGESGAELVTMLASGKAGIDAAASATRAFGMQLDELSAKQLREAKKEIDALSDSITTTFQLAIAGAIKGSKALMQMLGDLPNVAKGFAKFDPMSAQPDFWDDSAATRAAAAMDHAARAAAASAPAIDSWTATVVAAGKGWEATVSKLKVQPKIPDFTTEIDFSVADKLNALERRRVADSGEAFAAIKLNMDDELEEFRRLLADKKITEEQYAAARVSLNEIAAKQIGEAYEKERADFKAVAQSFGEDLTRPIEDAFGRLIRGTKVSWQEMLVDMAANVTQTFAKKSLFEPIAGALGNATATALGLGGNTANSAGNFLSSLLPMLGFANGGDVRAGVPVMVGERGRPERFIPAVPGRIEPLGRGTASSGAGVVNHYSIDARGSEIGVEQRIVAALAAAERQRPSPTAVVARDQRRFPARGMR